MKIYLIQHARTLNFLPTDYATGGTYWEGQQGKAPRVFHSRQAAASFIAHWVKGRAGIGWESSGPFGEPECVGVTYEDCGRPRRDIRICEATLTLEPIQEELL